MTAPPGGRSLLSPELRARLGSVETAALAGIVCSIGWSLALRGLLSARGIDASDREIVDYCSEPSNGTAAPMWMQVVVFSTIAFLWLVGVERGPIGDREPKLVGTVFLRRDHPSPHTGDAWSLRSMNQPGRSSSALPTKKASTASVPSGSMSAAMRPIGSVPPSGCGKSVENA
jgi:hypothetical protein